MVYAAKIKFVDDGSVQDVLISEFHDAENLPDGLSDDDIFFYGLSKDAAQKAIESGEPCENEWIILELPDIV